MQRTEILQRINDIFIDILDNEDIVITESSSANTIKEWDSLTHVHLVMAVEKKLKIRFTAKEIQGWEDVGKMLDCIQGRQK